MKPYRCPECARRFKSRGDRVAHQARVGHRARVLLLKDASVSIAGNGCALVSWPRMTGPNGRPLCVAIQAPVVESGDGWKSWSFDFPRRFRRRQAQETPPASPLVQSEDTPFLGMRRGRSAGARYMGRPL